MNPEAQGDRPRNTVNKQANQRTSSVNPFDDDFDPALATTVAENALKEVKRQASQMITKKKSEPSENQNQSPYNLEQNRKDVALGNGKTMNTKISTPSPTNPFESIVSSPPIVIDLYQNQNNHKPRTYPVAPLRSNPQALQTGVVKNSEPIYSLKLLKESEIQLPATLFIETVPLLTESQNQFPGLMYGLGKDYSDLYLRQGEGIVKSLYKSNRE